MEVKSAGQRLLSFWLLLKPPFGESLVQVFFCSCNVGLKLVLLQHLMNYKC